MTGLTLEIPGYWMERAACGDRRDDLFFPDATPTARNAAQAAEAKAFCRRCPVRDQCLAWALETGQGAGIWGGKDEAELRQLRRQTVRHGTGYAYNDHGCRCDTCTDAHARRLQQYRRDKRNQQRERAS